MCYNLQMNINNLEIFKPLFTKNAIGRINSKNKRVHADLYNQFCESVNRLVGSILLDQIQWHYLNNCYEIPKCKYCENDAGWRRVEAQYSLYCSAKCAHKDPLVREKREQTNFIKYGSAYATETSETQNKRKQTNIEKYGVEHPAQNADIKNKTVNKRKSNYKNKLDNCEIHTDVDDWSIFEVLFERTNSGNLNSTVKGMYPELFLSFCKILNLPKDTKLSQLEWHFNKNSKDRPKCAICDNYTNWNRKILNYKTYCSSKCAANDPALKFIKTQTNIERYGNKCPMSSPVIREKIERTNITRYGGKSSICSPEVRMKGIITSVSRYGVKNHTQKHIPPDIIDNYLDNPEWLAEQHHIKKLSLVQIANELDVNALIISRRFKKFVIEVFNYYTSMEELEVLEFIKNNTTSKIISNNRTIIKPYELDIYLPELKLAMEYDGIIWHSENANKDKSYHLNKTELCSSKNVQLIHIFSNEWKHKQDIVKSRLLHRLNKSIKIPARKCKIIQLSLQESNKFLEQNHLQGSAQSSIQYGLTFNNQLVAVMSFNNIDQNYELVRFCNILNHTVTGGASKLFKHFITHHNPESVISYSDRRWNSGKMYKILGFKFSHHIDPACSYFDNYDPDVLFDDLPELCNGYDRIWDCGQTVYKHQTKLT